MVFTQSNIENILDEFGMLSSKEIAGKINVTLSCFNQNINILINQKKIKKIHHKEKGKRGYYLYFLDSVQKGSLIHLLNELIKKLNKQLFRANELLKDDKNEIQADFIRSLQDQISKFKQRKNIVENDDND